MNAAAQKKEGIGGYMPLAVAAGIGSMLGSGIIVGLSATITVWQNGSASTPPRSACFPAS